ncbi:MAG: thioredoxin [candidate division Zixibacteria bacterium]|nr:thioredoxin [candidate division Zixibacteria bacterium]
MAYEVENFARDVIEKSRQLPVVVDFWAEWCGPCRVLGPTIEALAQKNENRWVLIKVDTEKNPDIAQQYGIRSIPAVKMFVDGEVKDEFVGALPERMIEQWLEKALPSPNRHRLMEAEELIRNGRHKQAEMLLEEIVRAEPQNHTALFLLAQMFVSVDPARALAVLEPIQEDSGHYDLAEALRIFARLFSQHNHPETLPEHAAKKTYLQAISDLRRDEFGPALEGFIETLRDYRSYDEGGGRRACVAIFKILGEDHELTRRYRRPFSNALYA